MSTRDQAADLLEEAADYIEKNGWIQGTYGWPGSAACTMGALVFTGAAAVSQQAWELGILALQRVAGTDDIPDWNDTEGRTKQQVLDVLREAAKKARTCEL